MTSQGSRSRRKTLRGNLRGKGLEGKLLLLLWEKKKTLGTNNPDTATNWSRRNAERTPPAGSRSNFQKSGTREPWFLWGKEEKAEKVRSADEKRPTGKRRSFIVERTIKSEQGQNKASGGGSVKTWRKKASSRLVSRPNLREGKEPSASGGISPPFQTEKQTGSGYRFETQSPQKGRDKGLSQAWIARRSAVGQDPQTRLNQPIRNA